jgi:hypothetical protein
MVAAIVFAFVFAALLFTLGNKAQVGLDWYGWKSHVKHPMTILEYWSVTAFAWGGGLLCAGGAALGVVHLAQRSAFVLSPDGLLDNSLIRPTFIAWSNIVDAAPEIGKMHVPGFPLVSIKRREVALSFFPASDIRRLHPRIRKLNCASSGIEPETLADYINEMREAYGARGNVSKARSLAD